MADNCNVSLFPTVLKYDRSIVRLLIRGHWCADWPPGSIERERRERKSIAISLREWLGKRPENWADQRVTWNRLERPWVSETSGGSRSERRDRARNRRKSSLIHRYLSMKYWPSVIIRQLIALKERWFSCRTNRTILCRGVTPPISCTH